jgi:hypothetical protein
MLLAVAASRELIGALSVDVGAVSNGDFILPGKRSATRRIGMQLTKLPFAAVFYTIL